MIDLTKPIEVRAKYPDGLTTNQTAFFPHPPPYGREESEAHRRLFEAAPKMLAYLKEHANADPREHMIAGSREVAVALIAEIEGTKIDYEEDWLRSKFLAPESFTPETIPPIEGGFYAKPVKVLRVNHVAPDYNSAPMITVEYEGGEVATGLVLFGKDRGRFEASRATWLARPEEERARMIAERQKEFGY